MELLLSLVALVLMAGLWVYSVRHQVLRINLKRQLRQPQMKALHNPHTPAGGLPAQGG